MSSSAIKSIGLVAAVAAAFSSLTLWLIDSWIKYMFFVFEIFIIVTIYLIINNYEVKLSTKYVRTGVLNFGLLTNVLFILFALVLLAAEALRVQGGTLQLILALLVTSILPGYALLNIFGFTRYFSRLETLVLSYIVGYAFTGLLTLILLPISSNIRAPVILGSFVALGLISALKRAPRDTQPRNSFSRNIDILALAIAISFYLVSFYLIYPGFALLVGTDISQHYAYSIALWRTPDFYGAYVYLLAHLHEATFIAISDSSVPFIQTALVTLNLLMPIAFYIMAKSYLEGLDRSLAAISTLFYSIFSGFAWIYLAQLKLNGTGSSILNVLSQVNDKAYNGAMYLVQPYLWFVPLSVSFTILMVQLMLLRKKEVPKTSFIALFSLLTIASFMAHVTEAVIFALFLSFYGLFSTSSEIRLDDALLASIFGLAPAGLLYPFLQYYFNFRLWSSLLLAIRFGAASLAFVYAYRRLRLHENLVRKLSARILGYIASASLYMATFGYFLGLTAWIGGIPSFHTWMVVDVGSIPWFIYPVFLGSIGVFAFLTFHYFRMNFRALKILMPFVALVVFSLLFGRALTYVNLNFLDTGYSEKRFTAYFFLGSAVLASVSLVKLVNRIRASWNKVKGNVAVALMLSIVVVYGVQSSFVVIEYWNSAAINVPSLDQMNAASFLAGTFSNDKYAFAITPSLGSSSLLSFAAPPYVLSSPQVFWTSQNPEIPLVALRAHNLSHAYIYTDSNDAYLLQKYGDGWFSAHLLPLLPIIYKNGGIAIYNASSVSFPSSNSSTALVLHFDGKVDPNKRWLYACDILSLGEYNFTAAYDLDPQLFKYDMLVLPIDPPADNVIGKAFVDDFTNQTNWKVISGTWQFTDNGAFAGEDGQYQDAILLSPVPSKNFTASVTFRPMAGDLKVANYVSIIYDWKDENNFKYAGLMFDGSGTVYAYFSQTENGQATVYPKWPGLNTELKWKFGDLFNLTVTLEGRYATLYVNGTSYLSTETSSSGGLLGIRSTRFYQVSFTSFTSKSYFRIQLRDPSEFLNYVAKGGKLVVLNTNGYGYFASKLFDLSSSTFKVDDIQGQSFLKLPENITVDGLSVKEKTASIVAHYGSGLNQSIYVAEQSYGEGKITYVNIYPIIRAIEESTEKPSWYGFLAEALKPAAVQLPLFTYTSPPTVAIVRELSLNGEVNVNTSSVIFPFANFSKVEILSNNKTLVLSNVTGLEIRSDQGVQIKGADLYMGKGSGFYSRLVLGTDISIVTNGSLSLSLNNRTILNIDHVSTIRLTGYHPITVLARQPEVSGYGQAVLTELYSGGDIYQKTRTQGQNLIVNGTVVLDVYLSDTYSWLSSLNIEGRMSREPPVTYYNELESLPQATFWSIILLPIFIALVLIARKSIDNRK